MLNLAMMICTVIIHFICDALAPDIVEEKPVSLDDLFRKTKTAPAIYWLPLTDEKVCQYTLDKCSHFVMVFVVHVSNAVICKVIFNKSEFSI